MLRKYNLNDVDRIVDIENKTLHNSLGVDFYNRDLENPLANHFVYEVNNKVIGFVSSYFDGEIIEILNFCIDPEFQSKGFGTKLMNDFFGELKANSSILEVRSSNNKAIGLYEKFGFKTIRIRKEYYSNGEDALFMQKVFNL
jgi:ribosomal-protein-alanine N-acetyltransferase